MGIVTILCCLYGVRVPAGMRVGVGVARKLRGPTECECVAIDKRRAELHEASVPPGRCIDTSLYDFDEIPSSPESEDDPFVL